MTEASDVDYGLQVSLGFASKVALAGLAFAGNVVFARLLGPDRFGSFYLLFPVVLIAIRPVVGFAQAAKKRFSEADSPTEQILGAQLLVVVAVSVVATGVATSLSGRLAAYVGIDHVVVLFALLAGSIGLFESLTTFISATGRVAVMEFVDFGRGLLKLLAQLGLVLLGWGAAGMAVGLALASLVATFAAYRALGIRPRLPTTATLRSIWEFARFSVVSSMVGTALYRVDVLLIGFLVSTAAVGQYEVAHMVSLPASFLATVAGNGLMARVSNFDTKDRADRIVVDVENVLSVTSVFAVPMLFGALALQSDIVVTLFGGAYREASAFLVWLLAYQVLLTQARPLLLTLDGLDSPDTSLAISAGTLTLNVILGVLLFRSVGVVGVVYATVVSEFVRYVAGAVAVRRRLSDLSLAYSSLGRQVGAAGAMYGVVAAASRYVPVDSWLDLALLVGLGGVVYGGILVVIGSQYHDIAQSVLAQLRNAIDRRFD